MCPSYISAKNRQNTYGIKVKGWFPGRVRALLESDKRKLLAVRFYFLIQELITTMGSICEVIKLHKQTEPFCLSVVLLTSLHLWRGESLSLLYMFSGQPGAPLAGTSQHFSPSSRFLLLSLPAFHTSNLKLTNSKSNKWLQLLLLQKTQ